MKYLIVLTLLMTSCSSNNKTPEKPSHWHVVDEFDYFPSVRLWRNDVTGTCLAVYSDSTLLLLPKEDCQ